MRHCALAKSITALPSPRRWVGDQFPFEQPGLRTVLGLDVERPEARVLDDLHPVLAQLLRERVGETGRVAFDQEIDVDPTQPIEC